MAKIQFSDVVPPERRSIRDVPIPNGGKRKVPIIIKPEVRSTPKTTPIMEEPVEVKNNKNYEYYYPKSKEVSEEYEPNLKRSSGKRFIFGGLALVAIVAFVVSMMTVFASAIILITPKSQDVEVSMDVLGTSEGDPSGVRYEIIKLSKSQTVSIPATNEESVELEAHGKIIIYNNFSFEPQRLIVRTRFESGDGLIYRIPESIVVPGKSVKDGVTSPGSIEVEIFADEPGEKYNIKKTDFTIPGFKSDAERYKNFYARSVEDMSGGFVGKMKTVSSTEKVAALKSLEVEAQSFLANDLQSKIGDGLVLLSNGIIYQSKELPQAEESSNVVLGKEVTAYAILLNSQDLSNKIVTQYSSNYPDWQNIASSIQDFSSLNLTKKPDKIESGQKINIQISGKAKILADINTDLISQKLVGVKRGEAAKLVDQFPGISSITATVRPMWKGSFPENPSKISVKTVLVK